MNHPLEKETIPGRTLHLLLIQPYLLLSREYSWFQPVCVWLYQMFWLGPGGPVGVGHTKSLYLHLLCGLHKHTNTHNRDGLSGSKACPLSIKHYTLWPPKHATLGARMASASQLLEPRHRAEGGAWGRDKLFLPWSLVRRGDRTGLQPQLSTADNIHMSVCPCVCVVVCWREGFVVGDVTVYVCLWGRSACTGVHIVKYHN